MKQKKQELELDIVYEKSNDFKQLCGKKTPNFI